MWYIGILSHFFSDIFVINFSLFLLCKHIIKNILFLWKMYLPKMQ